MDCVVIDLDGTLANCEHRMHYLEGPKKNWDAFFENCSNDTIIHPMLHMLQLLSDKYKIVFVTARPEKNRELTINWLKRNYIVYDSLHMRKDRDFNKSPIVKKNIVLSLFEKGYNPVFAFDDRPDCVAMFQELGIYAFLVGENQGQILY